MKNLRAYIRNILLENLGEKVFSTRAPPGHPHHGNEENTDEEDILWDVISDYILNNYSDLMMDDFDQIMIDYARNPKYSDVIKIVDNGMPLYRGMTVDIYDISGFCLGGDATDDGELVQQGEVYYRNSSIGADMEYEHADWRSEADQPISSWTTDILTAQRFAEESNTGNKDTVSVIMQTNASQQNGTFIDFRPFYEYKGLEHRSPEQEIAGFGFINVERVIVLEV